MIRILIFIALLLCSSPANALEMQDGQDAPNRTVEDFIKDYVDVPKGGTDWKVFSKTKEISVEGTGDDGLDFQYYKPGFSPEIKALDGKEITIKGYMFPLDGTEEQSLFLFGPFPLNCPYQYHVGSALVLEVHADKNPVKFDYEPITLKGTLVLVDKDEDNSVFYRLMNAKKL